MTLAGLSEAASFSSSVITNPAPNATLSSSTETFQWNDQGAPSYYLHIGSSAGATDYFNSGLITNATVDATGVPTGTLFHARLWTKTDDSPSNNQYWIRDFTYNTDIDSDGILDTIDLNRSNYNARTTLTSTNFALTVLGSGRVANLQISETIYDEMVVGNATAYMAPLSQMVLAYFDDVFDMIFFTCDEDSSSASYAGKHWSVQNDTLGLGKSLYDNSATYGSSGKLQSAIHFPAKGAVAGGPSLHEMMHRWANSLSSVPTTVGGHWGFAGTPGQLGGWDPATFQDLGGGQYQANNGRSGVTWFGSNANGGNSLPYSDFELYLMGLIPTNGLPDILIANNPAWVNSANGIFSADSITTVSIGTVVSTDGARAPDVSTSQKSFRIIHVILSTNALSNSRWVDYDSEVYNFSLAGDDGQSLYNFWEATGGRATVVMGDLESDLRQPTIQTVSAPTSTNGTAQILFTARDRVQYICDRSTDLTTWTTIETSISTNGSVNVVDLDATNYPSAFYRLRLQ